MKVAKNKAYRGTSLINNRKNNRPDGMNGPKKVKTKAKVDQTDISPFHFVVMWDNNRFYIYLSQRSGNETHCYHPKIFEKGVLPFPTCLLTTEQIYNTTEFIKSAALKAVGRNFLR